MIAMVCYLNISILSLFNSSRMVWTFSRKKCRELDMPLLHQATMHSHVFGMTTYNRGSHGGTTTNQWFMTRVEEMGLAKYLRDAVFVDAGCGIGHLCLGVLSHFPTAKYWGFDIEEGRVSIAISRLISEINNGRASISQIDMMTSLDEGTVWSRLEREKAFIYYNNLNLIGEVNEAFQLIVLKYAKAGTIIMALEALFLKDRRTRVDLIDRLDVEAGEGDFTWMRQKRTVKIFLYKVL